MKAEIILRLIERAREPLLKKAHLQEYARMQIEKDRERVKKSLRGLYDVVINETPITLD